MANEGAPRDRPCGRYHVARPWSVPGFQDPSTVVAVGSVGARKRRQSRQGTGGRRNSCGWRLEGEGFDRWPGEGDCVGMRSAFLVFREGGAKHRWVRKEPT